MRTLDQDYEPIAIGDGDDIGTNLSTNRPLLEIAQARLSRRAVLKGFVTTAAMGALGGTLTSRVALAASSFGFESLAQTITEDMQVAPGYSANVLIRWGDPVLPGAPAFDVMSQTAEAQALQFGYNNDFLGYFPLPRGSDSSEHGLLGVNFEYTAKELMFPGWAKMAAGEGVEEKDRAGAIEAASLAAQTPEQTAIEIMAHGGGVIEVIKENGAWRVVPDSQYARRITGETEMTVAGPAAGHELLKTSADPDRHQGARHAQQLRRRQDAVGHLAVGRGELPRLFRRRGAGRQPARRDRQALRRAGRLVRVGGVGRPLRRRQGAERAAPLRLDRRDRPLRPELRPGQAHRARPLQARGRDADHQQGRPARRLYRRRRAFRVPLQVRLERHLRPGRRQRQRRPARRRHPPRREASTRTS